MSLTIIVNVCSGCGPTYFEIVVIPAFVLLSVLIVITYVIRRRKNKIYDFDSDAEKPVGLTFLRRDILSQELPSGILENNQRLPFINFRIPKEIKYLFIIIAVVSLIFILAIITS